jgi:hypothetical protein
MSIMPMCASRLLTTIDAPCDAAGRNFVRGVLLGLMATFTGILIFSFPEYIQQIFRVQLGIPPALIVSCVTCFTLLFAFIILKSVTVPAVTRYTHSCMVTLCSAGVTEGCGFSYLQLDHDLLLLLIQPPHKH